MTKSKERYIEKERRLKHCLDFLDKHEMTQRKAAHKMGVTKQCVNQFIHGKNWSERVAEFFKYKREI